MLRYKIASLFVILFTFSVLSFSQSTDTLTVEQTFKLIKSDTAAVVVDCRDSVSYATSHLPRAIHLDVNDKHFVQKLQQFDKNKAYLIYSRTNGRSLRFYQEMLFQGFKQIYWFKDGFLKWVESGYSVVK